jgi:hypothetical protein
MTTRTLGLGTALVAIVMASPIRADVKSASAREAAEYVLQKFGKTATKDGVEVLTAKIEKLAATHGDEAIEAVRKVGPRSFRLIEEAGANSSQAIKVMARHGEDAAVWIVSKPKSMEMFLKYGDGAAEALVKHKGIAEPVIEGFGEPAVQALRNVGPENGRRLAMMADGGELAKIGRTPELLGVVAKRGDGAMDFIWRNKGALAVTAGVTAFLANPDPFIEGVADITQSVTKNVVKPVIDVPGQIAAEAAKRTNWTLVIPILIGVVAAYFGFRYWLKWRADAVKVKA